MNREVAVIKCNTYDEKEIYNALNQAFEMLGVYEKDWINNSDILLKPNLCLPAEPEAHLTTHPEIIRQITKILIEKNNIVSIGDTSIGYKNSERSNQVWNMTKMNDIVSDYKINKMDLQNNLVFKKVTIDGEELVLPFSKELLTKNIINVPKFKTHSYMLLTGCVKNLYGILAGDSKKKFHKLVDKKEKFAKLLLSISGLINNRLNIVDAVIGIQGEGPGAKGEIRKIGLIVVGYDAVLVDKVLAQIINLDSYDILTNFYGNKQEPIILGENIEEIKITDFLLPAINPRSDRIIQHIIEAKAHYAEINQEKCRRCGICYENCPVSAITKKTSFFEINKCSCISCFVCMEVCPYAAISIKNNGLMKSIKGESI